jgi:hypothetical protein
MAKRSLKVVQHLERTDATLSPAFHLRILAPDTFFIIQKLISAERRLLTTGIPHPGGWLFAGGFLPTAGNRLFTPALLVPFSGEFIAVQAGLEAQEDEVGEGEDDLGGDDDEDLENGEKAAQLYSGDEKAGGRYLKGHEGRANKAAKHCIATYMYCKYTTCVWKKPHPIY